MTYHVEFARDDLPDSCPPLPCVHLPGVFGRFVYPEDCGICSYLDWEDEPHNTPKSGSSMCISKSMSIFVIDAKWVANKFRNPRVRGRYSGYAILAIRPDDGHVAKTCNDPNHHSWWRSKACIAKSREINRVIYNGI